MVFISPLCALSAARFPARVIHHLLPVAVAVAAPLIAPTLPAQGRRAVTPLFLLAPGVLWAWHLPQAYDLPMANMGIYWVMQATLLGSATAFCRAVLAREQDAVGQHRSLVALQPIAPVRAWLVLSE